MATEKIPADKSPAAGNLDDDDYPAYTMGRAADLLGTTPPSSGRSVRPG